MTKTSGRSQLLTELRREKVQFTLSYCKTVKKKRNRYELFGSAIDRYVAFDRETEKKKNWKLKKKKSKWKFLQRYSIEQNTIVIDFCGICLRLDGHTVTHVRFTYSGGCHCERPLSHTQQTAVAFQYNSCSGQILLIYSFFCEITKTWLGNSIWLGLLMFLAYGLVRYMH